jgi:hypothetical protein
MYLLAGSAARPLTRRTLGAARARLCVCRLPQEDEPAAPKNRGDPGQAPRTVNIVGEGPLAANPISAPREPSQPGDSQNLPPFVTIIKVFAVNDF